MVVDSHPVAEGETNEALNLNTTEDVGEPKTRSRLFRNRSFLALWIGQFIAFLGNNVYSLALMWEMKVLTGSTVMMSTVSIATLIPMILLGPFAGVMVDRWKKRNAMIWADLLRAIVIGTLTVALMVHVMSPWMLIVGAVINSTLGSIYSPANSALVPLLVGRDTLQQANSVVQGTMVITQIIGPFVGGVLVAHVSMTSAFAANAFSYLASVASLLIMAHREPERKFQKLSGRQVVLELKEGLDVIRQIQLLKTLIPIAVIANFLFAPFEIVLIQYATNVLHGGAQLFGTLGAFFSLGSLLGAVIAGAVAKRMRRGILIAISFPLSTAMLVLLALTHTIWMALTLAVFAGLFNMTVNILVMTIIQVQVPQDKMGRVFGSFGTLIQGAQPFGQALGGYLLTLVQVPILMGILGGLATVDALFATASKVIRSQA
jgi:DHA3 family macrolide efflux protein-like MFS transporter